MKRRIFVGGVVVMACYALTACGGTGTSGPAGSTSAPASSASAGSTPTPTGSSVTEADLTQAMVTADDLGKPWQATSGGAGSVPVPPGNCPQPEASTTKLEASGRAWQGFRTTTAGLTTALTAHAGTDASDFKAAYLADLKKCTSYSLKSGTTSFVLVESVEGPTQVAGADEVLGSSVRRFYLDVKGRPLTQAIQHLACRKGSVIVEVQYSAYTTEPADTAKKAKDFTAASKLMQQQLAKVGKTISG